MPDPIRARLDWLLADDRYHENELGDALRAVLGLCADMENRPHSGAMILRIRRVIAEHLGATDAD